jgi:hypothetical protein
MIFTMSVFVVSAASVQSAERRDSLQRRSVPTEIRDFRRGGMMSSPLPVTIHQQGRQLCVTSRYNQLLPVYSANGTYYSAFRLAKGTNWLTGLPRGGYIINNKRYVIN